MILIHTTLHHTKTQAPTIEESVSTMIRMLDDGNHAQACFVAHSLGSTAVSWMLHDAAGEW